MQLAEHEGLEELAVSFPVLVERSGIQAQKRGGKPGVAHVQLRLLHPRRLRRLLCQGGSSSIRKTRSSSVT